MPLESDTSHEDRLPKDEYPNRREFFESLVDSISEHNPSMSAQTKEGLRRLVMDPNMPIRYLSEQEWEEMHEMIY